MCRGRRRLSSTTSSVDEDTGHPAPTLTRRPNQEVPGAGHHGQMILKANIASDGPQRCQSEWDWRKTTQTIEHRCNPVGTCPSCAPGAHQKSFYTLGNQQNSHPSRTRRSSISGFKRPFPVPKPTLTLSRGYWGRGGAAWTPENIRSPGPELY